jgi:hypothetical protein
MPKTTIYELPPDPNTPQRRRVEVGWQRDGSVQVGVTSLQPPPVPGSVTLGGPTSTTFASGGYLPPAMTTTVNTTLQPEPVLTPEQWAAIAGADDTHWDGWFADLDRQQVNHLIRTLREARDKAFGRDE